MAVIGKQIRAICAIINAQGPLSYRQVAAQMPHIELNNVHRCIQRAHTFGILTSSQELTVNAPKLWHLAPDWQNSIEQYSKINRKPRKPPEPPRPIINSVWSLGNL
jgi:hypothetical protein